MARDRDNDASTASQSKRPPLNHRRDSSSDQTAAAAAHQQQQQQQQHYHQRVKSQKHIVGGGTGGRLHARVPSSKTLHKHHATASAAKLARKHGSLSPDRADGFVVAPNHHRRTTSDHKLQRDRSAANLTKNTSQTNLKPSRSQADVTKRSKSASNLLHRSQSNPTVQRLKATPGSKVHFNLGDDDDDDDDQNNEADGEDEWVDASTSASPYLSRRGSTVSGGQPPHPEPPVAVANEPPRALAPSSPRQDGAGPASPDGTHSAAHSLTRVASNHSQYLTSRLLSRTPSHGAPPMMSTENVSVRPSSSRQQSPPGSTCRGLSGSPQVFDQSRPGSSGKAELTSRFVGYNGQESGGSGLPGDSFMAAANRSGVISRAVAGAKAEGALPRRPRSMGSLSQAQGLDQNGKALGAHDANDSDDEIEIGSRPGSSRARRSGYELPGETNRTQKKLNLQRVSSTIEPPLQLPSCSIGIKGVPAHSAPLIGASTYDSRDARLGRLRERTGMLYLVVRRYQDPTARALTRLTQYPGLGRNQHIPRPGTSASARTAASSRTTGFAAGPRESRDTRDPAMVAMMNSQAAVGRRPPTPRRAFSSLRVQSTSSSLETDDGERQALSGASLVDGAEDAGTVALLRNMWDKNLDLSASQD